MSVWGYYSPFFVGIVLMLLQADTFFERLDAWRVLPGVVRGLALGVFALLAGLGCQILMIGAQGAFAQVLPVPFAKSLRGRVAVVAGSALLVGTVLFASAILFRSEEFPLAFNVLAGLGVAGLVVALVAYLWGLPTAIRDFDLKRTEME